MSTLTVPVSTTELVFREVNGQTQAYSRTVVENPLPPSRYIRAESFLQKSFMPPIGDFMTPFSFFSVGSGKRGIIAELKLIPVMEKFGAYSDGSTNKVFLSPDQQSNLAPAIHPVTKEPIQPTLMRIFYKPNLPVFICFAPEAYIFAYKNGRFSPFAMHNVFENGAICSDMESKTILARGSDSNNNAFPYFTTLMTRLVSLWYDTPANKDLRPPAGLWTCTMDPTKTDTPVGVFDTNRALRSSAVPAWTSELVASARTQGLL